MIQTAMTPAAGKRLIATSLAKHPAILAALQSGTVVVVAGTTNGYVAEELLDACGNMEERKELLDDSTLRTPSLPASPSILKPEVVYGKAAKNAKIRTDPIGVGDNMTVRIGFLGSGFMGQLAHLENYYRIPNCDVVALAEIRSELGQKVAQHYGIPCVYRSHEELLADGSVDAIIASQPFQRNYYLGRAVLRAGKHLFTEKPMVATLADAKELVALAEKNALMYAVGFMKRYDPGVQLAQRIVQELEKTGELGDLKMVDTTCFLGDWLQNPGQPIKTEESPPSDDLPPRYPEHLEFGLRSVYDHFLNIYSHNVNLLHFFLSGRQIVCDSAHRSGHSFLVALRAGGALISLRGTPSRSNRWEEHTSLRFEKGRVEIQSATPMNRQKVADVSVWRESHGTWTEERLFAPVEWAFYRQAAAFVQAVSCGTELPTSGEKCLADVALMEDIFRQLQ
jgi:predicted dehydrogenase